MDLAVVEKLHNERQQVSDLQFPQGELSASPLSPLALPRPAFPQLPAFINGEKNVHPCDDDTSPLVVVTPQPKLLAKGNLEKHSMIGNGVDASTENDHQRYKKSCRVTWADDHGKDLADIRVFECCRKRSYSLYEMWMRRRGKRLAAALEPISGANL